MPRRLLAVAISGALALTGLAACRDLPTVAAYVGSAQLTNAEVESMVKEFPQEVRDQATGTIRRIVVTNFVASQTARLLAKEHNLTVPPADVAPYEAAARRAGIRVDGPFIRLQAEADAALASIAKVGTPQPPTDADKREIFASLVDQDVVRADEYEAVKNQIDSPQLRAALGLRPVMKDALHRYGVSVNPGTSR